MVLLASGGHCILGIVEDVDKFNRLGETKDIAPGEAFDKVSLMKILGWKMNSRLI